MATNLEVKPTVKQLKAKGVLCYQFDDDEPIPVGPAGGFPMSLTIDGIDGSITFTDGKGKQFTLFARSEIKPNPIGTKDKIPEASNI